MLSRRRFMNDRIASESGDNLVLQNVKGSKMNALTVYGKSTQDGTPSPENPVPIVSVGDEGEINVDVSDAGLNLLFNTGENKDYNSVLRNWSYGGQNGANRIVTGNQAHYTTPEDNSAANDNTGFGCDFSNLLDNVVNNITFKRGQKYVWSCDAKGISSPGQALTLKVFYTNASGGHWVNTGAKAVQLTEDWKRYSCEFTVPDDFDEDANRIVLNFPIGTDMTAYLDIKNLKLEKGTVATKWTPNPTDGDPLNYQSITFSTPDGLPGIPVSSGGNYTDENGQQWVCDEIDLARGKYIQRVGTETINGGYDFLETSDAPGRFLQNSVFTNSYKNGDYESICNIALWTAWGYDAGSTAWKFAINQTNFYLYPPTASGITTADELNAFLNSLGFPLVFAGQLATPIETDLPAEEIAAYKALHTYTPNTTVSNDAAAWMKVGYREWRR